MGSVFVEKQSVTKRFLIPCGTMLAIALVMQLVHNHLWQVAPPQIHQKVGVLVGVGGFLLRFLSPVVAYPWAYFRGANLIERAVAGSTPYLFWLMTHLIIGFGVFGPGQTVYYALNTIFMIPLFENISLMGICEVICRSRVRKRNSEMRVWTPGPILAFLSGPAVIALMWVWGGGVHWFYIYQEGYKLLFH